jgi:exodeoxyribonuclease III
MRLMTWNINSVRLRLPLLLNLIKAQQPDIICLQETKCPDELFPRDELKKLGYDAHISGMKSYNGVAILSRLPTKKIQPHDRVGKSDCRHIAAAFDGFTVHNLYIPAGGDIPDRLQNEKFGHKLDFIDEMTSWFGDNHKKSEALITCGDFNVAPLEHDVWSHKQLLDVVSHTPIEVEKLGKMQQSLNWVDSSREFIDAGEKCYTWWSYRNKDWKASNRGRRLDHIWVTPPLKPLLHKHQILVDVRDAEQTSDHVPVMIDLKD